MPRAIPYPSDGKEKPAKGGVCGCHTFTSGEGRWGKCRWQERLPGFCCSAHVATLAGPLYQTVRLTSSQAEVPPGHLLGARRSAFPSRSQSRTAGTGRFTWQAVIVHRSPSKASTDPGGRSQARQSVASRGTRRSRLRQVRALREFGFLPQMKALLSPVCIGWSNRSL